MDPLTVFKDFVLNKQLDEVVVDEAEGKVRFADKYSFPANAATAFRREGTAAHYPLGVVVLFFKWQAEGKPITEYIRTYKERTAQVALPDRADLIKYLTGEAASVPQLDENVPLVPFEPPAKRHKGAEPEPGEADALQHLFGHEKQLRDRNSLLCAPGANFTPVLHMVDRVLAARKQLELAGSKAGAQAAAAAAAAKAKAAAGQHRQPGQPGAQHKQPAFIKSSGRGDRAVDTKGALKALGAAGGIAEKLGLGYGLAATGAAAEPRARPAAAPNSSGSQHQKSSSSGRGGGGSDPHAAGRPSSASHKGSSSSSNKLRPIILVPAGYSAMVNLYNARQLLEDCHFVSSAEAQAKLAENNQGKPQAPLEFVRSARREGSHKPRYQITDKVPKAGHPDWKRVVAVIVQGKAWQFKDFPFKGAAKGDLVETFSNIFGAFFHYRDDAVPEAVQGWKVAKLPLRRDVRHLDDQVVLEFYDKLDAFLTSKRRTDLDY